MTCKEIKTKLPAYLAGELENRESEPLKRHLQDCVQCREEWVTLNELWTKLGVLPEAEPTGNLRTNFYTMLESYKAGLQEEQTGFNLLATLENAFTAIWPKRPLLQMAAVLILVITGFFAGGFSSDKSSPGETVMLKQEVQEMRQTAALSLMKLDSPSDRLMGVNWSSRLEEPGQKTLLALLDTLENDTNVNVRLSAVDALYLFSENPIVKQGLIKTLPGQDSPLVQIALMDLLVHIREKKAAKALKELIKRGDLNPSVRQKAQSSIQKLI